MSIKNLNAEVIKLYSCREAADLLHMSHEYCRKLCRQGKLPCRIVRRQYMFTAAYINKAQENSGSSNHNGTFSKR